MLTEVKRCADSKDIKGLRYIFADCLDVDPTFAKYESDYEYCKGIPGMFDSYTEMTALTMDESEWDTQYWDNLKADLMKNFAARRFEHMVKVARVVYADKVARLLDEREIQERRIAEKQRELERHNQKVTLEQTEQKKRVEEARRAEAEKQNRRTDGEGSPQEIQEKRIAEKQRELERHNQKVTLEQMEQKKRVEEARRANAEKQNRRMDGEGSKKGKGIGLIIVAAVLFIILIIVVLKFNPREIGMHIMLPGQWMQRSLGGMAFGRFIV